MKIDKNTPELASKMNQIMLDTVDVVAMKTKSIVAIRPKPLNS